MADIAGSAADDALNGTALADTLTAHAGSDLVQAGDGDDTLFANTLIIGDDAADSLYGGLGNDTLYGHSDDLLSGDAGADNIRIGSDTNAIAYSVTALGGDGDDYIETAFAWTVPEYYFYFMQSSTLDGGAGNDTISAGAKDSLILGGDGDDWIWDEESRYYDTGNNTIDGGTGNDHIALAAQNGLVTGGSGADFFEPSTTPTFVSGPGSRITDFTPGVDAIDTVNLRIELGYGDLVGGNLFTLGALRFQQSGDDGVLQYNHAFVTGITSWHTLLVLQDINLWDLAAGPNESALFSDPYELMPSMSLAALAISANTLGTIAAETWSGNRWKDTINGAGGDDTIYGFTANDLLIGDTGNDLLNGGGGADELRGGKGADVLLGGPGNDSLSGNLGNDVLTGASGADSFAFRMSLLSGDCDVITDFVTGEDNITVLRTLTNIAGTGTLADANFRAGTQALDADDRFIYDIGNGALYYDADGIGAATQVKFAQLDNGGTVLMVQDILLN